VNVNNPLQNQWHDMERRTLKTPESFVASL
jgi:hypothetical protein